MSNGAIRFAENDEYYTPKEMVDLFGQFDYDPATTQGKAEEFNIKNYDTVDTNSLAQDWTKYKKIWINPPFTLKSEFLEKAIKTYKEAKNDIYFLMPVSFLTTQKFHKLVGELGGVFYIPNGRLKFESGNNRTLKSPAFGTLVYKIGEGPDWIFKKLDLDKLDAKLKERKEYNDTANSI